MKNNSFRNRGFVGCANELSSDTPNLLKHTKGIRDAKDIVELQTLETDKIEATEKAKTSDEAVQVVSQLQLFRYASKYEIFLIFVGTICAIVGALLIPTTIVTFSAMVQTIVDQESTTASTGNRNAGMQSIVEAVTTFAIRNTIIGVGIIVLVYLSIMLLNYTSQRQAFRVRQLYLKSVLHQDISWYDCKKKSGNVATELTEDVIKFEEGIGEKFAIFIDHVSIFVFSIIFAFVYGWKLTLVSLVSMPITTLLLAIVTRVVAKLTRKQLDAFGSACSVAQEALAGIKTVVAYAGQYSESQRYKKHLSNSYIIDKKIALITGCGIGVVWLGVYASYALSQWYGITLVLDDKYLPIEEREYDASVMIAVFFCTMVGAMNIGAVSPYMEIFAVSRAAAGKIFAVIERKSAINSLDEGGLKPSKAFENSLEFRNVEFDYPSRSDVKVLTGLNMSIKKGETVALVGGSGCGKSTCIQLLQRFYDPLKGQVLFDGHDLRDLNVAWLRGNIGIVSQEPVLFDATIAQNIRHGKPDASMEMIINAAKDANAHDFIMKLPLKYDTIVGERGVQMSGGQKQRIAISRALIRNPPILLLDEATSALDTQSEAKVQAALDKAYKGRTTIIVAHRLSTIRNADKIVVLSAGKVVETGNHEELMELKGHYYGLVTAQISEVSSSKSRRVAEIDDESDEIDILSESSMGHSETFNEGPTKSEENNPENECSTWKVLKLNKPEWKPMLIAGIASFLVGTATPLFAILFGEIFQMLADPNDDAVREQSVNYAIYFIAAGILIGTSTCLQIFLLTIASESLTTRLRGYAFDAMLRQEMAWFDEAENGIGALCGKLSTEAAAVKGATGQRIGTIIQAVSTLVIGIAISIYYEWRLGLVGMTFIPLILFVTFLHGRVCKKETLNYHKDLEKSTKIAVEAVSNIRTVVGLGREETFFNDYVETVRPSFELAKRNTHYRGLVFGLFKSITCFAYAIVLYYGGVLMEDEGLEFSSVFKVAQSLLTGTVVIGQASAFSPNLQKGIVAAANIIRLIERVPKIQDSPEPVEMTRTDECDVDFNDVSFEYTTRPGITILDALNLDIQAGKTIGLVGPSGCGKSTIIRLLERFYDPTSGTVNLNRTNIATMSQSSLRMSLGLVEQEPIVFARTIRENIAYGDNSRDVTIEEVIEAAKKANIHNFVNSLPLGYETDLGDRGTSLSGGQKQRVAIARALVRNPQVLLLDEATSALDTESEKIVQAALDEAKTGRTCITIAHRLSTIEDADKICVFQKGRIEESGTHEELVRRRGLYYDMLCLQNQPS